MIFYSFCFFIFTNSKTVGTHIDRQVITNDIIVSKYSKNSIQIDDDGIYLGGDFINSDEFEELRNEITSIDKEYEHTMQDYKDQLQELSNSVELSQNVYDEFKQLFAVPKQVLADYKSSVVDDYIVKYTDDKVSELYEWFDSVKFDGWEEF